jgi:CO/xanthine dehydrogenase Mo-binding subunit
VCPPRAIANAVYNAIGLREDSLPSVKKNQSLLEERK